MPSDELKPPCPFCAGPVSYVEPQPEAGPYVEHAAGSDCALAGMEIHVLDWMRRAPTPELRELVEAVRALLSGIEGHGPYPLEENLRAALSAYEATADA